MEGANNVPRLLFLGTRGIFSRTVLESLLAAGKRVQAILVPGEPGSPPIPLPPPAPPSMGLPMLPSYVGAGTVELGWQSEIPIWSVGNPSAEDVRVLASSLPDVIVVACWPFRLPADLLTLPRWGALNVHPSLLPNYRGPAPLFWQLRDGLRESGVTIHRMSERLDEGPILAQAPLPLPDGATGEELDRLAARLGGRLLGEVLEALARGRGTERTQPAGGSYQGWPTERDFSIPTTWAAQRAWNFMRGTAEWGIPYTISLPFAPLIVTAPLAVAPGERLDEPIRYEAERVAVRFTPGLLYLPR